MNIGDDIENINNIKQNMQETDEEINKGEEEEEEEFKLNEEDINVVRNDDNNEPIPDLKDFRKDPLIDIRLPKLTLLECSFTL